MSLARPALLAAAVGAAMSIACAYDSGSAGDDGGTGASGAGGAGGEPGKGPLRVATFNAHNLFNDVIDGEAFVLDESASTPSAAEYDDKVGQVAEILAGLQADVLVLQEIENSAVVDDLAGDPALGRDYPHRLSIVGNDPRGIDLALLSNVPITKQVGHKNDSFSRTDLPSGPEYSYARDCLEVHMRKGGVDIVLLGVHFKSKSNDDPDKRLAEAQHTRVIADSLTAQNPERAVLIIGDFNDFPGTPPMDAIYGAEPALYRSSTRGLAAADRYSVETTSNPSGVGLHDDLVGNAKMDGFLDAPSVDIVHDDEIDAALADTSDHAPAVATYIIE